MKKQPGYVATFRARRDLQRALMTAAEKEVIARLTMATPLVWFQVKGFQLLVAELVKDGKYNTTIFHPNTVKARYGFKNMRQLRLALQALREAWKGVVRVQLCSARMNDSWHFIRFQVI